MRWYDAQHNRLVYAGERATPQFWADMWQNKRDLKKELASDTTDPLIPTLTRRFITPGPHAKILDGGCGIGQHVARLSRLGFAAYGIDNDQATVDRTKAVAPELKITYGDVRALPYPDNNFDGYWSIGVIEHWPEGYQACAQEMYRVLKPGGYLFLTFPHLSPLRKFKAGRHAYPLLARSGVPDKNFYQFALDARRVAADFTGLGFQLRLQRQTGGLKGLKDEISTLQPILQRLYNSHWLPAKALKVALSAALTPLAGHSAVLVFQKI